MKQLLQNMKDGQAVVVEMPVPGVKTGFALVKTAVPWYRLVLSGWWLNLLKKD